MGKTLCGCNISESIKLSPKEFSTLDIYFPNQDVHYNEEDVESLNYHEYFNPISDEDIKADLITFHNGVTLMDLYLHENDFNMDDNILLHPDEEIIFRNFKQLIRKNGRGYRETRIINDKLNLKRLRKYGKGISKKCRAKRKYKRKIVKIRS